MKKLLYLFILIGCTSLAQTPDSTANIKSSWFVRAMPYNVYTGSGRQADRISQSVEVGRSYGVMDFGLAYGRISLRPDSTQFVEAKATMNLAQYGIFSNEMIIGCGYVINSKTPLMLELSYTMYAQVNKHFAIGLITGYYNFSGALQSSDKTFFGLCVRYGLQRDNNGGLIKPHSRFRHGRR
jgi:hypothetical protein